MKRLARTLGIVSLALGGLSRLRVRSRVSLPLILPKFVGLALAPFVAVAGVLGAALGVTRRSALALVCGSVGAALAANYVRHVSAPHDRFETAFGADWRRLVPAEVERLMLPRRWTWRVRKPPEPRWDRDIAFWTIPGGDRRLVCDLWTPPAEVTPSGTAVIYLHGSAWYLLDKDVGTRPLFRELAAQGHVVIDVAYRLCPEVDLTGMVGDAKRAVAWMKANAARLCVSPERVVLVGASAGAHVALLAAYSHGHPRLTPNELRGVDTSVRAVVSYYGVADLRAYGEHTAARLADLPLRGGHTSVRPKPTRLDVSLTRLMVRRTLPVENTPPLPSHRQMMRDLVGGLPVEVPEMYDLASPINHVSAACPPTLLFHGEHDFMVPTAAARRLYDALLSAGVPAIYVEYPTTDHAFDLLWPRLAPAGQAALYDLERFLACVGAETTVNEFVDDLPERR